MNKQEFLSRLKNRLCGLPARELAERLDFYAEMIDDRVELGLSEEAAVAEMGDIDDIVTQLLSEVSLLSLATGKIKPRRPLATWEIVLLILGSPLWGSLLIAAVAVFVSLYASLWAVIASLWACVGAFAVSGVAGFVSGIMTVVQGLALPGFATTGAAIALAGLAILSFFGMLFLTKHTLRLTKVLLLRIKARFIGKGEK